MAKRIERQERNRALILSAARDEFIARGYRDAKIDAIAARAGLTRGAVYSNFAGKQELYLAALAEQTRHTEPAAGDIASPREALEALARAHVTALPLHLDAATDRLDPELVPRLLTGDNARLAFAQLLTLQTLLLSFGLERLAGNESHSMMRVATMALTILRGASATARIAPGLNEPFDVIAACQRLADMETPAWESPPAQLVAETVDELWEPESAVDALTGQSVDLTRDGVIGFFGPHRLSTVEQMARDEDGTTVVLVSGDGSGPLIEFVLSQAAELLRQGIPADSWPRLRVVVDDGARLASAAGITAVSDATEVAVRIAGGRIAARTEGFAAAHALTAPTGDRAVS